MPSLSLIAAIAANRVIGREGRMPWRIPEDLAWFEDWTAGKTLILGRVCYESWPKAHAHGRRPVVVSSSPAERLRMPVIPAGGQAPLVAGDPEQALDLARGLGGEIVVCGGVRLYAHFLPLASRFYLTEVWAEVLGDTLFPEWDRRGWLARSRYSSSTSEYRYTLSVLERGDA
jgi:dihydrofolate reductase